MCTPPWGERAFFAARDGGRPAALWSMNLRNGEAKPLLGPGGVMDRALEVGRVAVSPLPDVREQPRAPIPE